MSILGLANTYTLPTTRRLGQHGHRGQQTRSPSCPGRAEICDVNQGSPSTATPPHAITYHRLLSLPCGARCRSTHSIGSMSTSIAIASSHPKQQHY